MLSPTKLSAIGYNFIDSPQVEVTMGSGIVQVPNITLSRISALGQEQTDFSILAHALPPTSTIDGVLGLDFLRGHLLTVDFRIGQLSLVLSITAWLTPRRVSIGADVPERASPFWWRETARRSPDSPDRSARYARS